MDTIKKIEEILSDVIRTAPELGELHLMSRYELVNKLIERDMALSRVCNHLQSVVRLAKIEDEEVNP